MANGQTYPTSVGANSIIANHHHTAGRKGKKMSLIKKEIKEKKKMGWFRKKFNNWVRQAWDDARTETVDTDHIVSSRDSINGKSSVRFTVYPASGGFVIESYKQDRYKDSEGPTLTIVNHGDDLGKAVEHIIAIEALRS